MPGEPGTKQYVIVPKPQHPGMEVIGPFDHPVDADAFAIHYYAGQVAYTVREIRTPESIEEDHP